MHIYQCTRIRIKGTDWCKQHAEHKGAGAFLYSTRLESKGRWDGPHEPDTVELHLIEIVKETAKQYKLASSHGAFGHKTTLNKAEMDEGRFHGAIFTAAREALLWREASLMESRDRLKRDLDDVSCQLLQNAQLLTEHPE